jgi:phosphoglycerol transferase MdoB-like AlkP superfamily enzyme
VNQLQKADKLISDFINWLKDEGLMANTTVFIFGDHGQADTGWHPPYDPNSGKTELLIIGNKVKQHQVFEYAEIIDIVPTIAFIHQVAPPKYNEGRILKEAFKNFEDSLPKSKQMKVLNNLLLKAEKYKNSGKEISTEFKTILDIGSWHEDLDTISLNQFINRQRRFLD